MAPFSLVRTHVHEKWIIPPHMAKDFVPKGSSKSAPARRSAASSRPAHASSEPFGRFARFIGKAHSAMMKAFSFNCTENHDAVTRLITSKNALKSRMRDSRAPDVSDNDRHGVAPPSDFAFLPGPKWADFFNDTGGSGDPNDDDDDDDL